MGGGAGLGPAFLSAILPPLSLRRRVTASAATQSGSCLHLVPLDHLDRAPTAASLEENLLDLARAFPSSPALASRSAQPDSALASLRLAAAHAAADGSAAAALRLHTALACAPGAGLLEEADALAALAAEAERLLREALRREVPLAYDSAGSCVGLAPQTPTTTPEDVVSYYEDLASSALPMREVAESAQFALLRAGMTYHGRHAVNPLSVLYDRKFWSPQVGRSSSSAHSQPAACFDGALPFRPPAHPPPAPAPPACSNACAC